MSIRRRYEEFFAALFLWSNERWGGNHAMASTYTYLALFGGVGMDIFILTLVIRFGFGAAFEGTVFWVVFVGILVPFGVINYFWLLRRERYLRVAAEFAREAPARQLRMRRLGFAYLIGSYGVAISALFLAAQVSNP